MTLNADQFAAIHAKLGTAGGFTVDPHTGADITSGISVAPRGNERKIPIDQSTPDAVAGYHADNTARFGPGKRAAGAPKGPADSRNASLGGWRSEDSDYLDTPTVYKNTPAGERGARKQMVLSGQEAAFHLDSFTERFNPFHAEGRRKGGFEGSHEIADIASRGRDGAEFAMKQPEVQAWVQMAGRVRARRSGADSG